MSKFILSTGTIRYPLTGIGRYTLELARELAKLLSPGELIYCDGERVNANFELDEQNLPIKSKRYQTVKDWVKKSHRLSEWYFWLRAQKEGRALSGYENCLVHTTNFICPLFNGKKIVTFHDMSAFLWEGCQEKARVDILKKQCEYTIAHADALLTVSEAAKREIVDYFSYPQSRIFVTPLACSSGFRVRSQEEVGFILQSMGLTYKSYCLFVGTIEPRKNISFLLSLYEKLPLGLRLSVPLVICGHSGWKSENVHQKIMRAQAQGWVKYLNYVPHTSLLALYSGAKIFLFPSLYEGFGLPVLEAMASGVPVISASNSSLPEVVGNAGILLSSSNEYIWADKIQEVIASEVMTQELIANGLSQASQFSWQRCAKETLKAYEETLKK